MTNKKREIVLKRIKLYQKKYLLELDTDALIFFEKRFKNLYNKLRDLSRKEYKSINGLKCIPLIAKIIFGLYNDICRAKIKTYSFKHEINLICLFVHAKISDNIRTQYNNKCKYGETLLNCYLDLIITLTTRRTEKELEAYPEFLINPLTNKNMELDVLFDGFKLSFEFQGETHYTNISEKRKDIEKIRQCTNNNIILIPVNAYQLNSLKLFDLIANSVKDYLGIGVIVENIMESKQQVTNIECSKTELLNFFKVLQRIKMAHMLFATVMLKLDTLSDRYINTQNRRSPITTTTNALRAFNSGLDYNYLKLYRIIPTLNKLYKNQS